MINGEIAHKIYSNFEWTDADGYLRDFVMKDREEAVRDWMQVWGSGAPVRAMMRASAVPPSRGRSHDRCLTVSDILRWVTLNHQLASSDRRATMRR